MQLYHGSNVLVEQPRLFRSDRRVDFGSGFYVTSSFEQATRWAQLVTKRRGQGEPTVTVYEFDVSLLDTLTVRSFDGPTVEWLHFVGENRCGTTSENADDLVIGPVANDNTMPTLRCFLRISTPRRRRSDDCFRKSCTISGHLRLNGRWIS